MLCSNNKVGDRYKRRSEPAPNGLGLVNMPYTKPNTKPTLPLGGKSLPLGGKFLPLGGKSLPLGGKFLPLGGKS